MDIGLIATVASLLGLGAKDLAKLYLKSSKQAAERFSEERLAARYQSVSRILAEGLITKLMLAYYPNVSVHGLSRFALSLGTATEVATTIVGSPSFLDFHLPLLPTTERHHLLTDPKPTSKLDDKTAARILAEANARGLRLWDQPIYRLHDFSLQNDSIVATFSLDQFMRYRLGIGALLDETIQALIDADCNINTILTDRPRYLPLREQFLPTSLSIAQFRERMCAGGIHVTMAFQRPDPHDDYVIPIQRRSRVTSEGQDMISVLPQAFHQPTVDPQHEVNLQESFYREVYEELFGGEEAVSGLRRLQYDWYKHESPQVKWFAEHPNEFRLVLTGFGLNMISGNYEFSLLCVVRSPAYWNEYGHKMITNWEADALSTPLISSRDREGIERLILQPQWTGSGLFSFARGLYYLAALEPGKVSLPQMKCAYIQ